MTFEVDEDDIDTILNLFETLHNAKVVGHYTYSTFQKKYHDKPTVVKTSDLKTAIEQFRNEIECRIHVREKAIETISSDIFVGQKKRMKDKIDAYTNCLKIFDSIFGEMI